MSTYTVTITFTVKPATGPNINNHPLELIDADGDRIAYIAHEDDVELEIRMLTGLYNYNVERS